MTKAYITFLLTIISMLPMTAQTTIGSIRETYRAVKEDIGRMSDNFPSEGIPPEYYQLKISQMLPATGGHFEDVRMYYGEERTDPEGEEDYNPYPPHFLRFVTVKYNFAAREFYEEYLYDEKGRIMFIYALTPDIGEDMIPHELRLYFDGKRLLNFNAKKGRNGLDVLEIMRLAAYDEVFSGTTIPEPYAQEAERIKAWADKFLHLFKAIDNNTHL